VLQSEAVTVSSRPARPVETAPPAAAVTRDSQPVAQRSAGSTSSRRAMAVVSGLAILAVGIAAYVAFTERDNESRAKIAALEKQIQDKDLADASRQRAARQAQEEEARRRQEQEQQARAVQEKSRTEAAAKGNAVDRNATGRATPENARVAEKKRPDETVRPAPQVARAAPAVVPPVSAAPAPAVEPAAAKPVMVSPQLAAVAPQPAALAPQPAAPTPEATKVAPPRTPMEQLVEADRAIDARRFADALAILRPLADGGNARAQTLLGDAYVEGRGIPRDPAAAGRWYEKAALQGETGAQVKLATMYVNGNGVLRNNNLAYVWFGTAARLGSTPAKLEQEKIAALLQPAERAQADKLIESSAARMPKNP